MRVIKIFVDYNKEEQWLNNMAKKGYELEAVGIGYKFRKANPQNTIIRIDNRQFKSKEEAMDYRALFEDSGWQHIAGRKRSGEQYFKKIGTHGEDDIFSDHPSKASRYKKLSHNTLMLAVTYFVFFMALTYNAYDGFDVFMNPKLFYFTPGLWEMNRSEFWYAFLFETPFVLFRVLPGFLCVMLFIVFSFKANKLYKEEKNQDLF